MPLYLSAESVTESLGSVAAEFVPVESVPQFLQALKELTECEPTRVPSTFDCQPYINPFGTARGQAAGRAYKSERYPSNDSSVTIYGWATQQDRGVSSMSVRACSTLPCGISGPQNSRNVSTLNQPRNNLRRHSSTTSALPAKRSTRCFSAKNRRLRRHPDAYLPPGAGGAPLPVAARGALQGAVGGGFNFQPWQVAAFITAVRTKPFVILAGRLRVPSAV